MTETELYFSNSTLFNIVSGTNLKLLEALNHANYTEREKNIISFTNIAIVVNRANLILDNITVRRDVVADKDKATTFIRAVYQQTKGVTLTNSNFYMSGRLLRTFSPINLHVENVSNS